MIVLCDHIQQSHAELAGCIDPEERLVIVRELMEAAKQHYLL
jgi:hypothetical protein